MAVVGIGLDDYIELNKRCAISATANAKKKENYLGSAIRISNASRVSSKEILESEEVQQAANKEVPRRGVIDLPYRQINVFFICLAPLIFDSLRPPETRYHIARTETR